MALTDPVPSQAIDVFKRNMEDVDSVVNNTSGTVINRTGTAMRPLPVVMAEIELANENAGYYVVFSFSIGGTLTARNQLVIDSDGMLYRWGGELPKVVSASSTPEPINSDAWVLMIDNHNSLSGRDMDNSHPASSIRSSDGRSVEQRLSDFPSELSAVVSAEADRAESAADAASLSANIYADTAAGLAATTDGDYFNVVSSANEAYLDLYKNNAGSAVFQKSYPSTLVTQSLVDNQNSIMFQSYASDKFVNSGFINKTNGNFASSASWISTDLLPVIGESGYIVDAYTDGNAAHAWYDSDGVFIASFGDFQTVEATYYAPSNARFFRLSSLVSLKPNPTAISESTLFDIQKLKQVIEQHNPSIDSKSVTYNAENVKLALDRIESNQNKIIQDLSDTSDTLDIVTDASSPLFISAQSFIKSYKTATTQEQINVLSQTANSVTLTAGGGAKLAVGGSFVAFDGVNHRSFGISGISGDVVTANVNLPSGIQYIETMNEAPSGQHLSRLGYKGLAEHIVDTAEKYAYKKAATFAYNPSLYVNDGVNISDGVNVVIPVTAIGTAGNGGFVSGTTNLLKYCRQTPSNTGVAQETLSKYLLKYYELIDGVAGNGFEISIETGNKNGFIEMQAGLAAKSYNSGASLTAGEVILNVTDENGNLVYTKTFTDAQVEFINFDYQNTVTTLNFRFTLIQSTPTAFYLCGLYAYSKSPETNTQTAFSSGDVIAFLGDSWTQYPLKTGSEVLPLRPDGSTADGMQFLSTHMQTYLQSKNISVTTLNMGRSGQTSAWGLYWVDSIINLTPKPTHCVVFFGINDRNSVDEFAAGIPSVYDFDPENQWAQLDSDQGGVFGSTSKELWFSNMRGISQKLIKSGIKPVILIVGQTASEAQSQEILSNYTSQLVDGF